MFTLVLWGGPSRFIPGYQDSLPTARTRQGVARGEFWLSRDWRYFNVFRGIQYAKQPLAERRFVLPEALDEEDSWSGVRDFNREMARCYQIDLFTGLQVGREDCLHLNVYSPDLKPAESLPVMVFFHGGGFVSGTGDSSFAGPSFFMDHEVVLVSVNYRLGIFGFLSLETEEAPGNLGLWDQRMALLWVKRNIKQFGGDPARVTIFGNSAGSMSVNFHLVSPHSAGLFSRAIMQSGTVLSPYLNMAREPGHYSSQLAGAVGCHQPHSDTLRCLQSVPASQLYRHLFMFEDGENLLADLALTFPGPWLPVRDSDFSRRPFIPDSPEKLIREGRWNEVPVMLGFTSEDGLLSTSRLYRDPAALQRLREDWTTAGPYNLLGRPRLNISQADVDQVNFLLTQYTDKPVGQLEPGDLTGLFTDALFGVSTHSMAQLLVSHSKQEVYKYLLSYKGER